MLYSSTHQSLLACSWRFVSGYFHGREGCLTVDHYFAHQFSVTLFTCKNPLRMTYPHNNNWLDKDSRLFVASFYIARRALKVKCSFDKRNSVSVCDVTYMSVHTWAYETWKNISLLQFHSWKVTESHLLWQDVIAMIILNLLFLAFFFFFCCMWEMSVMNELTLCFLLTWPHNYLKFLQ